jgi:pyruvate/2-oxoglutarate/acetoin dehydrogenase E1 component
MRPIVELMTVNFSLLALDQILNTAASVRHMSGNQFGVPLVIRMATGAGRQLAAQHSHSLEGWYAHIPGIKVLAPATLEDARGMLWTALEDPDPVLIFENVMLYNVTGALAPGAGPVGIDKAAVRRPGRDISLITYGGSLGKTLEAAGALAGESIEAEVIDLRSLRPLDDATIMASVRKTRRAVIVDEGWRSGSLAAEICTRIVEQAFWDLDAPVGRVCSEEVPIPYPRHLEEAALPQVPTIVAAAWARSRSRSSSPALLGKSWSMSDPRYRSARRSHASAPTAKPSRAPWRQRRPPHLSRLLRPSRNDLRLRRRQLRRHRHTLPPPSKPLASCRGAPRRPRAGSLQPRAST